VLSSFNGIAAINSDRITVVQGCFSIFPLQSKGFFH